MSLAGSQGGEKKQQGHVRKVTGLAPLGLEGHYKDFDFLPGVLREGGVERLSRGMTRSGLCFRETPLAAVLRRDMREQGLGKGGQLGGRHMNREKT